jgi:hypothetical protein
MLHILKLGEYILEFNFLTKAPKVRDKPIVVIEHRETLMRLPDAVDGTTHCLATRKYFATINRILIENWLKNNIISILIVYFKVAGVQPFTLFFFSARVVSRCAWTDVKDFVKYFLFIWSLLFLTLFKSIECRNSSKCPRFLEKEHDIEDKARLERKCAEEIFLNKNTKRGPQIFWMAF